MQEINVCPIFACSKSRHAAGRPDRKEIRFHFGR
jgi:hypothetical protein